MAGRIKSLLPTLSVSFPAVITGILIFSENKFDPLTSLFSKSEEEKKTKGEEEGDEKSESKGEKGKDKKLDKGKKGEKDGVDEGNGGEGNKTAELEGKSDLEVQEGERDGDEVGDSQELELQGQDSMEGQSGVDGADAKEQNLGGENGEVVEENKASVIAPSETTGEATEKTGKVASGGRRPLFSAFLDLEDVSEEYFE